MLVQKLRAMVLSWQFGKYQYVGLNFLFQSIVNSTLFLSLCCDILSGNVNTYWPEFFIIIILKNILQYKFLPKVEIALMIALKKFFKGINFIIWEAETNWKQMLMVVVENLEINTFFDFFNSDLSPWGYRYFLLSPYNLVIPNLQHPNQ